MEDNSVEIRGHRAASSGGSVLTPLPNDAPNRPITESRRGAQQIANVTKLMIPQIPSKEGGGTLGRRSIVRGQFDQTIRTMKEGKRVPRNRPLSKMFVNS